MKKKISIVGSGLTGIISALYLYKKNIVSVYDLKPHPGGVLTDVLSNTEDSFFKGCQYINAKSDWFKLVKNILPNEFKIFKPAYYSYTEKKDQIIASNKFALPVFKNIKFNKYISKSKNKSLLDRYNNYDSNIKNFMYDLTSKYSIKPEKIISSNAINLQLNRICSLNQSQEIARLKKNIFFDKIYALEAKKLNIFYKSALPKNGYNIIFKKLSEFLEAKGVQFHYRSRIYPNWNKDDLVLNVNGNILKTDFIVWTGNPVVLINNYFKKKMESINFKIKQFNFASKKNILQNIYIQVFSNKTSITRIFLYKLGGHQKISVECVYSIKEDDSKIIRDLKSILSFYKINLNLFDFEFKNYVKYLRHDLCSLYDFNLLNKFRNPCTYKTIICSDWEEYGRDIKIDNLRKTFLKKNLL